jgi:dolichol-phosphate mannosyltransferase
MTGIETSAVTDLSIIVPTFNECDNVAELIDRLAVALACVEWEVIVVDDDSPDGTSDLVRHIARRDRRVRCLQRVGRRGLSSACIEGMLSTCSPYLAVMDGDLQHDETALPRMLDILRTGPFDIVVASRYARGGSVGDWDRRRALVSRLATALSRRVVRADLADPLSGYFVLRREVVHEALPRLTTIGFKVLLDLFASSPRPLRFTEFPYAFRPRRAGQSKLETHVAWDHVLLLVDKLVGHVVPVRFVSFSVVGALGVLCHVLALTILFRGLGVGFVLAQAIGTVATMTFNFALNNVLTYGDRRLRGRRLLRGWLSYLVIGAIGAAANVGVASYLFLSMTSMWAMAGVAGTMVGAVWNYAVTAVYIWDRPRRGRGASMALPR